MQGSDLKTFLSTASALLLAALGTGSAAAQEVALSYTLAQAEAGRAAYEQHCQTCHGPNLDDGPLAPPLRGPSFIAKYGGKIITDAEIEAAYQARLAAKGGAR